MTVLLLLIQSEQGKHGLQEHPRYSLQSSENQALCPSLPAEASQLQPSLKRQMWSSLQSVSKCLCPPRVRSGCLRSSLAARQLWARQSAYLPGGPRGLAPGSQALFWGGDLGVFCPSGESNRFLYSDCMVSPPASSPLHSLHSPANVTFPSLAQQWDSREQPLLKKFSPLNFSPGQASPKISRDRLTPQEWGMGTPLLLTYWQAPAFEKVAHNDGTLAALGAGTVISTRQWSAHFN